MSFQNIKTTWKVGIIFYLIALIAYIVGFATPEWYVLNLYTFGLFRLCGGKVCLDSDQLSDVLTGAPDVFRGVTYDDLWTPSLAILGLGLAALLIGGILVVAGTAVGQSVISLIGGLLVIVGGIFGLAGGLFFMIKGTDTQEKVGSYVVGYSSIILLIGSIVEIVSGSLLSAGRPSQGSVGP